jgi:hypothetical protein
MKYIPQNNNYVIFDQYFEVNIPESKQQNLTSPSLSTVTSAKTLGV